MNVPENPQMGRVTGRFGFGLTQTPDGDQVIPAFASVEFVAEVDYLLYPDAKPSPLTILPRPVTAKLDQDGYVVPLTPDESGQPGVPLMAPDGSTDTAWLWKATVRFSESDGGRWIRSLPPIRFRVRAGHTKDLSEYTEPPNAKPVSVAQSVSLAVESRDLAAQSAAAAEEARQAAEAVQSSARSAAADAAASLQSAERAAADARDAIAAATESAATAAQSRLDAQSASGAAGEASAAARSAAADADTALTRAGQAVTASSDAVTSAAAALRTANNLVERAAAGEFKGDKGDAGGWNIGVSAGETNLNALIEPGLYYQNSTGRITPELNYPPGITGAAGRCAIHISRWGGAGAVLQEVLTVGSQTGTRVPLRAARYLENGTWGPWSVTVPQRTDNTAGRAIYAWDASNNREQLIYGDTGWRNVAAELILPGFECTSLLMRRDRNVVTVAFDGVKSATASGHAGFMRTVEGFRPDMITAMGNQRYGLASELSGGNTRVISPEGQSYNIRFLSYVSNLALHGQFSFVTREPWPTSLPGVAVGNIPNM